MISTAEPLKALGARLLDEEVVAFDLEADSMHHYQEKVCLVQIATPSLTAIVDPLAVTDLSPLAPVLGSPTIRKVFHGADYDIRSLHRDFGIQVENLFDTMIACQLLGESEVGLAAVLRKRFGAELDKRYQKADWSRRPLPKEMIEYAVEDTTLLVDLYGQLVKELLVLGRLDWVEEESEIVSRARFVPKSGEPLFNRVKGAGRLKPRDLAVLEELLKYREAKAKAADVPPFKVLGAETLMFIAQRKPSDEGDLLRVPGMSAKTVERHGHGLLKAVTRGLAVPAADLPVLPQGRRPKRSPVVEERLKQLKEWREKKSRLLKVEPGIMLNNASLEALAEAVPRDRQGLDDIPILRRWQKKEFGEELLALLV